MIKTRPEILKQYTEEILALIKLDVATHETVFSALNAALTEYAITLQHLKDETLKDAHGLED